MKLGGTTPYGYGYGWEDNQPGQDGSSDSANPAEWQALLTTPASNVDNDQPNFTGDGASLPLAAPAVSGGAGLAAPGVGNALSQEVSPSSIHTMRTVSFAGSGLVFNNTFTGLATNASFENDAVAAENYLASLFTSNLTVNVSFTVAAINPNFSAENSFNLTTVTYANYFNALKNEATSAVGLRAVAALSNLADPSNGNGFALPNAYARMLGLGGNNGGGTDDSLTLNSDFWTAANFQSDPGDTEAVIEHELSEGSMGRVGSLGLANFAPQWAPMDLFRYTAAGVRDFTGGSDGQLTFFSPDGSNVDTGLQFHNSINAQGQFDGFDLADWDGVGADINNTDPFGPGGPGVGDPGTLSATDIAIMEALGWNAPLPPNVTESLVSDTGISNTDKITSDPAVGGSGDANATVTITENGNTLGTAMADGNGNWTFTPTTLADGTHTLVASETSAGGTGTASLTFTLDTTPPAQVHDTGLTVAPGATVTITASMLDYNDNISADANETYTVVQAPGNGQLLLNGAPTTGFTQGDIDNGLVSYHETAAGVTSDDIVFDVADQAGNTTAPKDFFINVSVPPPAAYLTALQLSGSGQVDFLTFSGPTLTGSNLMSPGLWNVVANGDYNGDSQMDLVTQGPSGQIDLVFLNGNMAITGSALNGTPFWAAHGAGNFAAVPGVSGPAVITQSAASGQIDLLWLNSSGSLAASDLLNGSYWNVVGAGDFNDDGKNEIVTQSSSTGQIDLLSFTGSNLTASLLLNGAYDPVKAVDDFNHDGIADLTTQNPASGFVDHLVFTGPNLTGSLAAAPTFPGIPVVDATSFLNHG